MKVSCVICGELLEALAGICAITCGHTFHSHCLFQWLERAKTCPQCRKKTTDKNIVRLYFDSPPEPSQSLDPIDLQNQLDNLKFQITLKEQENKNLKENDFLKTAQVEGLRSELEKENKLLKQKDKQIGALTVQVNYLQQSAENYNQAKKEASEARNKLKTFEVMQQLVEGSSDDIENTLSSYSGANNQESLYEMATFISILKKELRNIKNEKRNLQGDFDNLKFKYKEMKKKLALDNAEIVSLKKVNSLLHEDKHSLEEELRSKARKISSIEKAVQSPSGDFVNSAINRLINESPAPLELKGNKEQKVEDYIDLTPKITKTCAKVEDASSLTKKPDIESPYLQVKSTSVNPFVSKNFNLNGLSLSKPSLLLGKRRSTLDVQPSKRSPEIPCGSDLGYDGFGGHSKPDIFPVPTRLNRFKEINSNSRRGLNPKKASTKMPSNPSSNLKYFWHDTFGD